MLAGWLWVALGCADKGPADSGDPGTGGDGGGTTPGGHDNVLILVADDLGIEASACYPDQGVSRAPQPHIERLCGRGVAFEQAWSMPVCSPTRAGMLTGRASWRHGVGEAVPEEVELALSADERSLPRALALGGTGHAAAHVGKWHLGRALDGPNTLGWSHFAGPLLGEVGDYYDFEKVVDGQAVRVDTYATTDTVDDALAWLSDQQGPWVLWVAFNAPHTPLHLPPEDLHSQVGLTGAAADVEARPAQYFQAMVEAMDTEIGRLLDGIGEDQLGRTWVIYVGDNGSTTTTNQGWVPDEHAKATLYQGGVHVPLVVAPPLDPDGAPAARRVSAPVGTVDLFATVLDLAGASAAATEGVELDSLSFAPLLRAEGATPARARVLSEVFGERTRADEQGRALGDGRYKLIEVQDRGQELYDLEADPLEQVDLLDQGALDAEAGAAYEALAAELAALPDLPVD
ncbi:sulfatase-like hydrolase/transferase [Myxococcota bacterium]|nr:sulfatase-like hydrolase/transferase [Myxococcota bacterium]